MKTVLTIAGSDCSGGAGIQADIKTITAHGLYAMSAITALTAQNTTGVYGIQETEPEFLRKQLTCIFSDIYPDAVKIGMISSKEQIEVIAQVLETYPCRHVVLDTVMIASSGQRLLPEDAIEALTRRLFPLATLLTPNIPEAEYLTECLIRSDEERIEVARALEERYDYHGAILLKGGHAAEGANAERGSAAANDLLWEMGKPNWIYGRRINSKNTHGTGCTLSSAIACNLALGRNMITSVTAAKKYLSGALLAGLDLGKGNGPLDHSYVYGKR